MSQSTPQNGAGGGAAIPAGAIIPAHGDDVEEFMLRMARDHSMDEHKLRVMYEIRKERLAELARIDFLRALSQAQAEFPVLSRDTPNDQTSSRYTRFETIWETCLPIWTKHGLVVTFDVLTQPSGLIRVQCQVGHINGYIHSVTSADAPTDDAGPKGTKNKTVVQGNQAAVTYIKRGLLCNALGIVTRYEDDDGNSGVRRGEHQQGRTQTQQQKPPALSPWVATIEKRLDAAHEDGWKWAELLKQAMPQAPTLAALDELLAMVAKALGNAPEEIRTGVRVVAAAERKRLKAAPPAGAKPAEQSSTPKFEGWLFNAYGERAQDLPIQDPMAFAKAIVEAWSKLTNPDDATSLAQHNADGIEAARAYPGAAKILDALYEQRKDTRSPDRIWADATKAKLRALHTREAFAAFIKLQDTQRTMSRLRKSNPDLFNEIDAVVERLDRELTEAQTVTGRKVG